METGSSSAQSSRQVGSNCTAVSDAGDSNLACIGIVGVSLGYFDTGRAHVSSVHGADRNAGAGWIRLFAAVFSRPVSRASARGFAAEFRKRAALAEPPGAAGKAGIARRPGGWCGVRDRTSADSDYAVLRETVVESAAQRRSG